MKLKTHYYSQFTDVQDKYWMPRACLPVCLKIILSYHGKADDISIDTLITDMNTKGGYYENGWRHDHIVEKAKEFGFYAYRQEQMNEVQGITELRKTLDAGNPVIVSVIKFILGQTKFHTVVLVGYEEKGGAITGFYFHDPESTSTDRNREAPFVDIDTFKRQWRRMAIFIEK
jgi:hypothetical protein